MYACAVAAHWEPSTTDLPPVNHQSKQAVMISHDNLTWTVKNFIEALPFTLTCEDRSVSYLPLSHVAAQVNNFTIDRLLCFLSFRGWVPPL